LLHLFCEISIEVCKRKHRLFHHWFPYDRSMLFGTFRRLKKLLFAGASHVDRSLD